MTVRRRILAVPVAAAAAAFAGGLILASTGCERPAIGQTQKAVTTDSPESEDGIVGPKTSAEWWQWALSIPTSVNPLVDTTGASCMVGQRGSLWFLAGTFFPLNGSVTRTCSIPENVELFFPVINVVNINTPGICGQVGSFSADQLRAQIAPIIDGATNVSVELDGKSIKSFRRIKSRVFADVQPQDNIFQALCVGLGGSPAGIFSPSVDDGIYATIHSLEPGNHQLHFHAESPSFGVVQDVTYNLTVMRVHGVSDDR
jgi:hypothetical protein